MGIGMAAYDVQRPCKPGLEREGVALLQNCTT